VEDQADDSHQAPYATDNDEEKGPQGSKTMDSVEMRSIDGNMSHEFMHTRLVSLRHSHSPTSIEGGSSLPS